MTIFSLLANSDGTWLQCLWKNPVTYTWQSTLKTDENLSPGTKHRLKKHKACKKDLVTYVLENLGMSATIHCCLCLQVIVRHIISFTLAGMSEPQRRTWLWCLALKALNYRIRSHSHFNHLFSNAAEYSFYSQSKMEGHSVFFAFDGSADYQSGGTFRRRWRRIRTLLPVQMTRRDSSGRDVSATFVRCQTGCQILSRISLS